WAQLHPDEVSAIIGLDPAVPAAYDLLEISPNMQLNMLYLISRLGLSRWMPDEELNTTLPLMASQDLSEEEKDQYRAIFYRSSLTRDMLNELKEVNANAKKVAEDGIPSDIPMYFFISEDQDVLIEGWKDTLMDYLSDAETNNHRALDTGHYVHHEKGREIADEIRIFMDGLEQE
ncbi:MAG: alpha/beta hydrolase, partial [Bacillota bacterium]